MHKPVTSQTALDSAIHGTAVAIAMLACFIALVGVVAVGFVLLSPGHPAAVVPATAASSSAPSLANSTTTSPPVAQEIHSSPMQQDHWLAHLQPLSPIQHPYLDDAITISADIVADDNQSTSVQPRSICFVIDSKLTRCKAITLAPGEMTTIYSDFIPIDAEPHNITIYGAPADPAFLVVPPGTAVPTPGTWQNGTYLDVRLASAQGGDFNKTLTFDIVLHNGTLPISIHGLEESHTDGDRFSFTTDVFDVDVARHVVRLWASTEDSTEVDSFAWVQPE